MLEVRTASRIGQITEEFDDDADDDVDIVVVSLVLLLFILVPDRVVCVFLFAVVALVGLPVWNANNRRNVCCVWLLVSSGRS